MMFIFDDFVLYIEKQSYTVQTHLLWMTLGKDGDYLNVKDCHLSLNLVLSFVTVVSLQEEDIKRE